MMAFLPLKAWFRWDLWWLERRDYRVDQHCPIISNNVYYRAFVPFLPKFLHQGRFGEGSCDFSYPELF
jgi:hypothetical protein